MNQEHTYIKVSYDGEMYHYTCSCGHVTHTIDGHLPVSVGIA